MWHGRCFSKIHSDGGGVIRNILIAGYVLFVLTMAAVAGTEISEESPRKTLIEKQN